MKLLASFASSLQELVPISPLGLLQDPYELHLALDSRGLVSYNALCGIPYFENDPSNFRQIFF